MNHILIVDDKPENLYFLQILFKGHGYEVEEARHGAEALVKARQKTPVLVVSDLLMPIMDGYTLLRHWKADERLRLIPFVVFTATYTEPKDEELAINLGADAFIIKPMDPEPFIVRIKEVLAIQKDGLLSPPRIPTGDDDVHLKQYSESLVRKLEEKTLQLEQANRALEEDIAQRKKNEAEKEKLQAQLIQAQKMESVGRLAGGVAHDFNNMLGIILGYTDLALGKLDKSSSLYEDLVEVKDAAMRSAEITRQLLAFARKQSINPRVLDLNVTVPGMLKMLNRLVEENIDLHWQPASDLWFVEMDPSQIDQILVNLCINARDAIAGFGKIIIETGNVTFDEHYCAMHVGSVPGDYILLSVSDTGCGMDSDTMSHLFEPFYTTKKPGKGTGLGLATVYGIVKQNNGFINVYSEPGKGTSFKVYLRRHGEEANKAATPDKTDIPAGKGETILVTEDNVTLLKLTGKLLAGLGYEVLQASTPAGALKQAAKTDSIIHLLLTDVVMPVMNGHELSQQINILHPNIKVLFMSGFTTNAIVHQGLPDKEIHFIQKPFSVKDLACKVRAVLDDQ